jgi:hypothetical protein
MQGARHATCETVHKVRRACEYRLTLQLTRAVLIEQEQAFYN